jgi:2-polyprenyl-6-methoxyphenol hydroxylase-like FAD-dependent oxidoreductase
MNTSTIATDVLIIGGGPVGLALALELCYQGVDCILVEQSDGVVTDPKVSTIGPRSMELCRRWGIAQQIRAAGFPSDHTQDIAWVTAIGGHEIFRVAFPAYADRSLPVYTPEPEQVCPQNWFVPIFLQRLEQAPNQPVHLRRRLDRFEQTDTGVKAQITNLENGQTEAVYAQYMVACDGARSGIRQACGVAAQKYHDTSVFQSVVFHAPDLATQLGSRNAMVFYLVNPTLQEPLRAVDGQGQYRLILKPHADGQPRDPHEAIREALAIETSVEIISNLPWHLTHRVAEQFRQGRIFFVGDAAHTLSPSGGFGMNTGIGDALDLGWKLAATLKGWAGSHLLDTYETERKPIAIRNLEEANANLQRTQNRVIPAAIMSNSPEGEQIRQQMALGMERSGVRREFDAPGVHFGVRYVSPVIVADGQPPIADPHQWTQSSYPGCRAPHAWLEPGKSTLDLFGRGFVLMSFQNTGVRNHEGLALSENTCRKRGVPLTVSRIDRADIAELYERSYILVRPDGHVAWRGDVLPTDPDALIAQVCGYQISSQCSVAAH